MNLNDVYTHRTKRHVLAPHLIARSAEKSFKAVLVLIASLCDMLNAALADDANFFIG